MPIQRQTYSSSKVHVCFVTAESMYQNGIANKVVHSSEILAVSQKADIDLSKLSATWTIGPQPAFGPQTIYRTCPSPNCPAWVYLTVVDRFTAVSVMRLDYSEIIRAFPGETRFLVTARLGELPMRPFNALFNGKYGHYVDLQWISQSSLNR